MKSKPILFSTPMVRALLDGTKTQTRRVVKLREGEGPGRAHVGAFGNLRSFDEGGQEHTIVHIEDCPFGQAGSRLWVREAHAVYVPGCEYGVTYRADHLDPRGDGPAHPLKWLPSIFMPRWACRLELQVTDVRVERLQEISEHDARAEGVIPLQMDQGSFLPCFEGLWDILNAKRGFGWDSNPFVWVVSFEAKRVDREAAS